MTIYQQISIKNREHRKAGLVHRYQYKSHVVLFDSGSEDDKPTLIFEDQVREIADLLSHAEEVKYFSIFRLGSLEYQKRT